MSTIDPLWCCKGQQYVFNVNGSYNQHFRRTASCLMRDKVTFSLNDEDSWPDWKRYIQFSSPIPLSNHHVQPAERVVQSSTLNPYQSKCSTTNTNDRKSFTCGYQLILPPARCQHAWSAPANPGHQGHPHHHLHVPTVGLLSVPDLQGLVQAAVLWWGGGNQYVEVIHCCNFVMYSWQEGGSRHESCCKTFIFKSFSLLYYSKET